MRPTHGSAPVGDGVPDVPRRDSHTGLSASVGEGLAPPAVYVPRPIFAPPRRGRRPRRPVVRSAPGHTRPRSGGACPSQKKRMPVLSYEVAQIVRESFADTAGPPRTSAPTAGTEVSAAPLPVCATGQRAIHESPGTHGVGIRRRAVRERPLRRKSGKKRRTRRTRVRLFMESVLIIRGGGCAGDQKSSSAAPGITDPRRRRGGCPRPHARLPRPPQARGRAPASRRRRGTGWSRAPASPRRS